MRDDAVRHILWAVAMVGFLLAAASWGDPRHLRCVLYAGLALMGGSSLLILRSVIAAKAAPAGPRVEVINITEAPSVALQAAENAERIGVAEARLDCHAIHLHDLYRAMMDAAHDGQDGTQPMPKLRLADPAPREGSGGLCPVGAGLAVIAGGTAGDRLEEVLGDPVPVLL